MLHKKHLSGRTRQSERRSRTLWRERIPSPTVGVMTPKVSTLPVRPPKREYRYSSLHDPSVRTVLRTETRGRTQTDVPVPVSVDRTEERGRRSVTLSGGVNNRRKRWGRKVPELGSLFGGREWRLSRDLSRLSGDSVRYPSPSLYRDQELDVVRSGVRRPWTDEVRRPIPGPSQPPGEGGLRGG